MQERQLYHIANIFQPYGGLSLVFVPNHFRFLFFIQFWSTPWLSVSLFATLYLTSSSELFSFTLAHTLLTHTHSYALSLWLNLGLCKVVDPLIWYLNWSQHEWKPSNESTQPTRLRHFLGAVHNFHRRYYDRSDRAIPWWGKIHSDIVAVGLFPHCGFSLFASLTAVLSTIESEGKQIVELQNWISVVVDKESVRGKGNQLGYHKTECTWSTAHNIENVHGACIGMLLKKVW